MARFLQATVAAAQLLVHSLQAQISLPTETLPPRDGFPAHNLTVPIGKRLQGFTPAPAPAIEQLKTAKYQQQPPTAKFEVPAEVAKQAQLEQLSKVMQGLSSPVPDMRAKAANILVSSVLHRVDAEQIPGIVNALRSALGDGRAPSEDKLYPSWRADVARAKGCVACALGKIGAKAEAAIPEIIELLKNKDHPGLRRDACDALAAFGPAANAAVSALAGALHDKDMSVVMAAAGALYDIGPDAAAADLVKVVNKFLKDPNSITLTNAGQAAAALSKIKVVSPGIITSLLQLASHPSPDAGMRGLCALLNLGSQARPALEEAMKRVEGRLAEGRPANELDRAGLSAVVEYVKEKMQDQDRAT